MKWCTCLYVFVTGTKWGDQSKSICSYCRTCRFDNVCLNLSSYDIQCYKGNKQIPLFYDNGGKPHHEFPADFVETGQLWKLKLWVDAKQTFDTFSVATCRKNDHCQCFSGHSAILPRMHWAPTMTAGNIPQGATFVDAPVVAYVSLNDLAGNFGHACLISYSRCTTPLSSWTSTSQISNFYLQSIK